MGYDAAPAWPSSRLPPHGGQRPSICEELVLGNSTLKKPTWANAELYGDNHSHRAFQTHISTFFVHDIGFPRKRGRVGGLPNDDASTHFGGRTRGGRLAGWRAAGLRLAGKLAGGGLAAGWQAGGRRACGWLAGWLATSWRLAASELTEGGDNRAGGRQSNAEGPAPRPAQSERQGARSRPMPWCRARRRARRRLSPRNACRHLQPAR